MEELIKTLKEELSNPRIGLIPSSNTNKVYHRILALFEKAHQAGIEESDKWYEEKLKELYKLKT